MVMCPSMTVQFWRRSMLPAWICLSLKLHTLGHGPSHGTHFPSSFFFLGGHARTHAPESCEEGMHSLYLNVFVTENLEIPWGMISLP